MRDAAGGLPGGVRAPGSNGLVRSCRPSGIGRWQDFGNERLNFLDKGRTTIHKV